MSLPIVICKSLDVNTTSERFFRGKSERHHGILAIDHRIAKKMVVDFTCKSCSNAGD